METLFLTVFVVGLLVIPLLYWLSTRETEGKQEENQEPASNEVAKVQLKQDTTSH